MITVCSRCHVLIRQISPLDDKKVSHGLCREHELEFSASAGFITPEETAEWASLRSDYVELRVRVPSHVAERLRELCALAAAAGRGVQVGAAGGLALTREINRTEYEGVPGAVYSTPAVTSWDRVIVASKIVLGELR